MLTVNDHNRMFADGLYIYPVVSRRAGGVSVGVNLNPNNACNWRCVYCQVEGLTKGAAPEIDVERLRQELRGLLHELQHGSFMQLNVPENLRHIRDIALAGNGEPTSSHQFAEIIQAVLAERDAAGLANIPVRVISNGSFMHRAEVREGLRALGQAGGEVWFKVDAGSEADMQRINSQSMPMEKVSRHLRACAEVCPTWVQTCVFREDGVAPDARWLQDYLAVLHTAGLAQLQGVLLYGIARPSMQAEAARLQPLSAAEIQQLADGIRAAGLTVQVSV